MKILIAPDSFKHSLTGAEVAEAIKSGIHSILKEATIHTLPLADGGEGTVAALVASTGGKKRRIAVHDPLMRKIEAEYGIINDDTAVIEMAAASGLELISNEERNPLVTTTFGTGELIKDALDNGFKKIIIGVGGSATNDAGAGMAQALGARLLNDKGEDIDKGGGHLDKLKRIDLSHLNPALSDTSIHVAVDVKNPLTGEQGATKVYAPQKGADPTMVDMLERNLAHFADVIWQSTGNNVKDIPGGGAAGGLAAGLAGVLGANIENGFNLISKIIGLERYMKDADLVITGEGMIDSQTAFGKTPHGVAMLAKKYKIPVVGFAGTLGEGYNQLLSSVFDNLYPITEKPVKLDEALHAAEHLLFQASARMMRSLLLGNKIDALKPKI